MENTRKTYGLLERDSTIIKVHGKQRFISIKEAFAIGKILLEFVTTDANNKQTMLLQHYMDISDFSYLCHIITNGSLAKGIKQKDAIAKSQGKEYPEPAYKSFKGKERQGQPPISRRFEIMGGKKTPVVFKATEGLGKVGDNGQIMPDYSSSKNDRYILVGLSAEDCVKIGLAGKRAIEIYDRWCADRVLDQRVAEISYRSETPGQNRQYNNPQGGRQYAEQGYNNQQYGRRYSA